MSRPHPDESGRLDSPSACLPAGVAIHVASALVVAPRPLHALAEDPRDVVPSHQCLLGGEIVLTMGDNRDAMLLQLEQRREVVLPEVLRAVELVNLPLQIDHRRGLQ